MEESKSLTDIEKTDENYHYMDENGDIHVVNVISGEIVRSAPRFEDGKIPGRDYHPVFTNQNSAFWNYNQLYHDLIVQLVAKGHSFTSIAKRPEMPCTTIIAKWRRENPDFEEAIKAAKQARAEGFVDQIIDSLEETKDLAKDEVPAEKLWMDKLKWLAEKSDPKGYGTKSGPNDAATGPVQMIINTGVPLDSESPNVKTIEVEHEQFEK